MKFRGVVFSLLSLGLFGSALGWHPTDTTMDGDSAQSGYLPNHNMDPEVIAGGTFGQIWQLKTPASFNGLTEQFYAKPLVYTPAGIGRQVVIAFSEQNRIYVIDAVNGTLYKMRDLNSEGESPFNVDDLANNCNDISGTIGITGTPVIDNTTDTIYFWAKGYKAKGQRGFENGIYRFHAVDAFTLAERPGFPTNIEGVGADNDATRRFTGGTVLQRPSLNLINSVIYTGFGGHCDAYNYTGWLIGMKANTGTFVTAYSTNAGPRSKPQDGTWQGGGGGAGIWMGGSILASDNPTRLFFATGNSYTTVNDNLPARGKDHLDTLSECMVKMTLDPVTGKATQADYFEPATYKAMDMADTDLGSGGVSILPFSGGGVNRLAVTAGKNGQCFVTNADNLGGFKMGPGGNDDIIQTITPPVGKQFFGAVGAYPLEGGYMYMTPIQAPTYAYQLGSDGAGRPAFSLAGQTAELSAGRPGTGSATVTSMKGAPGSGILWVADTDSGIRAYRAVPQNGKLVRIPLPAAPNLSKFQRPVFGDGRYYTTAGGMILGFGSPVSLPFDCTGPLDFGGVSIGQTVTLNVTCKAKIAVTKITGVTLGNKLYTVGAYPSGPFAAGASVVFPITFNLTGYQLTSGSTSSNVVMPGVQVGSVTLSTQNGVTGYSTLQPISVSANIISAAPFVTINPNQIDFSPVILGSDSAQAGSDNTLVISNMGQADMIITGYAFTKDAIADAAFTNVTQNSNGEYLLDKDGYFTSDDLPPVGTVVKPGSSVVVHVNFKCSSLGDYFTILNLWTNGGRAHTTLTGSASSLPIAELSYKTNEGGWNPIPSCPGTAECSANISMGASVGGLSTTRLEFKIHNAGGSDLIITKSKPPMGTVLGAENPMTDFAEGLTIAPGKDASGIVYFSPGKAFFNSDPVEYAGMWTLNVNDIHWGVHGLNFFGTVQGKVVGPLIANGKPRFRYSGCYLDSTANRIETVNTPNVNNTNGQCMQTAVTKNNVFAALEYQTECWTGNKIPSKSRLVADYNCDTYLCPGDKSETCGGIGSYATVWYDATGYFPANDSLAYAYQPPTSKPAVGRYVYVGCRKDATGSRTLSQNMGGSASNSLEYCAAKCTGYTYFGVEFANECFCGNTIGPTGQTPVPETDCSSACPGDSHELCGAAGRLSLYALNGTVAVSTTSSGSSSASAGPPTSTPKPTYSYVDCYEDSVGARTLRGAFYPDTDGSMSIDVCSRLCTGYAYFGVEYGGECYCDNAIAAGVDIATDGRCSMICHGNPNQVCGGSDGLSVYRTNSTAGPTSGTATSSTRTSTGSTISVSTTSSVPPATPTVTVRCPDSNGTTYTAANGKTFLLECYIDHAAGDLAVVYVDSYAQCCETCAVTANCNAFSWVSGLGTPCYLKSSVGAPNQNGGIWGAKVVAVSASSTSTSTSSRSTTSASTSSTTRSTTTLSTSSSSTRSATLSTSTSTSSSSRSTTSSTSSSTTTSSTSSSSTRSASSSSSSISSTSTRSSTTSAATTSSTSSRTSRPTTSSTTSSSSSSTRSSTSTSSTSTSSSTSTLSTSTSTNASPVATTSSTSSTSRPTTLSTTSSSSSSTRSSTSTSSTSTSSSTSSRSTTSTAHSTSSTLSSSSRTPSTTSSTTSNSSTTSTPAQPTGWIYTGCAPDSTSNRTLNGTSTTNPAMTPSLCQSFCASKNYPFAGLEYGTQCYCGLGLAGVGQAGCTMPCPGDATKTCGGKSRLDVYEDGGYIMPWLVREVGNKTLRGCFRDSAAERTLGKMSWKSGTGMSVEACVEKCKGKGYGVAGVTYGSECYCDDVAPVTGGPLFVPDVYECMVSFCGGNKTEFCGGRGRILVYA